MEGHFSLNMKRKEFEEVNDDFSNFTLSSPARKIRRLDAELPLIIAEEDGDPSPIASEFASFDNSSSSSGGIKIEELPNVPENEERAIVLFKQVDNPPLLHSPSSFSISVNPDLISGFKNQVLWSNQSKSWRPDSDEATEKDNNSGSSNGCLAVVPWIPSQLSSASQADVSSQFDNTDTMDAEEMEEEVLMDVEEGASMSEGLHQLQQHCMIPQPPQNNTTPVVWYQ